MKEKKENLTKIPDITHTFSVVRKDAKGKIVRDNDENPLYDEFVYDYKRMSISRMLAGKKLFYLANKEFQITPSNTDELTALVTREAERQAIASILMKKTEQGFEKYNSYETNSFAALDDIECGENAEKLMECLDHFFLKVGLMKPDLMIQSLNITNTYADLMKSISAISEISGLTGVNLKEILIGTNSPQEPPNVSDSTI